MVFVNNPQKKAVLVDKFRRLGKIGKSDDILKTGI